MYTNENNSNYLISKKHIGGVMVSVTILFISFVAPQFVGSFDVVDRVLFFFREMAIEVEPEHKLYSRVAKVCKVNNCQTALVV
jgi:hypothetical protein